MKQSHMNLIFTQFVFDNEVQMNETQSMLRYFLFLGKST